MAIADERLCEQAVLLVNDWQQHLGEEGEAIRSFPEFLRKMSEYGDVGAAAVEARLRTKLLDESDDHDDRQLGFIEDALELKWDETLVAAATAEVVQAEWDFQNHWRSTFGIPPLDDGQRVIALELLRDRGDPPWDAEPSDDVGSEAETWLVKRLHDLRSGKPECSVALFHSESAARAYIAIEYPDHDPYDPIEGEDVTVWALMIGDTYKVVDEFVELELHIFVS